MHSYKHCLAHYRIVNIYVSVVILQNTNIGTMDKSFYFTKNISHLVDIFCPLSEIESNKTERSWDRLEELLVLSVNSLICFHVSF